jgi:AcrR family transcriptional regulator
LWVLSAVGDNGVVTAADASPRRGRPPRGATQLSRAAIIAASLAVIDADGVDAVSMRSVARTLAVDAKSLYNHVRGKDDLLDGVAEQLLGSLTFPDPTGDVRRDLHAIAYAFRERALLHPAAAPLVLTRQLGSWEGLAPVDAVLGVLRRAGCPPEEAVHLLRTLVATLIGTLLREVSAGPTFGVADRAGIAARRDALDRSGLPAVQEVSAHLARFDRDAEFAFTVDLAVDAVMARVDYRLKR